MAHQAVHTAPSQSLPSHWSAAFRNPAALFRDWANRSRIYHITYRELARCSERELADISISRADIPKIAAEAARNATGGQAA